MISKMLGRGLLAKGRLPFVSNQRHVSNEKPRFNVAVVGAAGGIGQPLSMLLRTHPQVGNLALYDLKMAQGIAVDLSHLDVRGETIGVGADDGLEQALDSAQIVVVPAGMPRKPGQSRADLFKSNADIIAKVADGVAQCSPKAFLVIITNPVNSIVPVAAEVLKKHDVYDPSRLFGVTTLDMVRARKFIGDHMKCDPQKLNVPVIGGHSAETIIPLLSKAQPEFFGEDGDIAKLTDRIKNGGTEVVEAKCGKGSATLSMAMAGATFVNSLLKALGGETITEIAYVHSCVTETTYFSSIFNLGEEGVIDFPPLPELSDYESQLMCEALPKLKADIEMGEEHGKAFKITKNKKDDDKKC